MALDIQFAEERVSAGTRFAFPTYNNWWNFARIPTANLTVGNRYLVLASADVWTSATLVNVDVRLMHTDATPFLSSPFYVNSPTGTILPIEGIINTSSACLKQYQASMVVTAQAGLDIMLMGRASNSSRAGNFMLMAIDLDTELAENFDWFYSENTVEGVDIGNSYTQHNILNFTPLAGEDYLILGSCSLKYTGSEGNSEFGFSKLESSVAGTVSEKNCWRTNNTWTGPSFLFPHVLESAPASPVNFSIHARGDILGSLWNTWSSTLFAMRIANFTVKDFAQASGSPLSTITGSSLQVDSHVVTPNAGGKLIHLQSATVNPPYNLGDSASDGVRSVLSATGQTDRGTNPPMDLTDHYLGDDHASIFAKTGFVNFGLWSGLAATPMTINHSLLKKSADVDILDTFSLVLSADATGGFVAEGPFPVVSKYTDIISNDKAEMSVKGDVADLNLINVSSVNELVRDPNYTGAAYDFEGPPSASVPVKIGVKPGDRIKLTGVPAGLNNNREVTVLSALGDTITTLEQLSYPDEILGSPAAYLFEIKRQN